MKIAFLEPSLEPIFWKYVSRDIPHFYFFAFDWKYNRDKTEIMLALEGKRIKGMMLIYRQYIVQFRGSPGAVKALLEKLDLEKVELQAPRRHKSCILAKYEPTMTHELMLMTMRRGEEKLQVNHPLLKLDTSDAEQIAALMRDADPEFWGDTTSQQIIEGMSTGANLLGIKVNNELVSLGSARVTEFGGLVGVVATHEAHRNKGYATSIVSELVRQIFEKVSTAMIFVRSDNLPAVKVYSKVGFKPYRKYFFMRGEKRQHNLLSEE